VDAPKPSDFEELKRLMLKQTGGDGKLAAVRTLSFAVLWCLAEGIRAWILGDLIEVLRFESERQANEQR
jgi:hypothetical protein